MNSLNDMMRAGCTTARGIHFWEEKGLLGNVARSDKGTRRFTDEQLEKAKIIAAATFGGWSLDEVGAMLAEWGQETYEAIMIRLDDQMRAAVRLGEQLPKPEAMQTQEWDL